MRDFSEAMSDAIEESVVRPFFLLKLQFDSGYIYLSSTNRDLSWDSHTWLGNGWFRDFPKVTDGSDITTENLTVKLSGIPLSLIALVLGQTKNRNEGVLYFGLFNESHQIISDPIELFAGYIDVPKIEDSIDSAVITITIENENSDFDIPRESRFTDNDQQAKYPGDTGFRYVAALANKIVTWGKPKSAQNKKGKKKNKKDKGGRE